MSNISDLMLQKGQIQANARLGSAQAKMGAINGIANTIATTAKSMSRLKSQELADKSAALDFKNKEITHEGLLKDQSDKKTYDEIMGKHTKPDTMEVDYQAASRELASKGLIKQSDEVYSLWNKQRIAKADEIKTKIDQFDKGLSQARTLMRAVTDQASLDRLKPALDATVGPELSKHIPSVYDKATFDSLSVWGADAQEAINWQNFAINKSKEAFELEKGTTEQREKERAGWAGWVATTGSQKEYDDAMNAYFSQGVSTDTLTMFGNKWSKAVKDKAKEFALGVKEVENNKLTRAGLGVSSAEATARARENDRQQARTWYENAMIDLRKKLSPTMNRFGEEVIPPIGKDAYDAEAKELAAARDRMLSNIPGTVVPTADPSPVAPQAAATAAAAAAPPPVKTGPKSYKQTRTKVIEGITVTVGSNDGVNWTRIR